jgi:hypothetical protein
MNDQESILCLLFVIIIGFLFIAPIITCWRLNQKDEKENQKRDDH